MSKPEFKQYRRKQVAELADWYPGMDLTGVSISDPDHVNGSPLPGDKIARNPKNHADRWLIAKEYFEANFEPLYPITIPTPPSETPERRVEREGWDGLTERRDYSGFAKRVLGEERYDNSPCQAHPLELVEEYVRELLSAALKEQKP